MPIKIGNINIAKIFSGTTQYKKAYTGNNKVYELVTKLATPTTGVGAASTTVVNFTIKNEDSVTITATYQIRRGDQTTGTLVGAASSVNITAGQTVTVSSTTQTINQTYFLVNVIATAAGRDPSDPGIVRSTLLRTPNPTINTPTRNATSGS
jgi:hypothetical protein